MDEQFLFTHFKRLGGLSDAAAWQRVDAVFRDFDRLVAGGASREEAGKRVKKEWGLEDPTARERFARGVLDLGQGFKQARLMESDPEAARAYTEKVNYERLPFDEYTDKPGVDWARLGGKAAAVAPLAAAIPSGVGPVALGMGTALGAMAGVSEFSPEGTEEAKKRQGLFGAVGGLGGTIVGHAAGSAVAGAATRLGRALGARMGAAPDLPPTFPDDVMAELVKRKRPGIPSQPQIAVLRREAQRQLEDVGEIDVPTLVNKMEIEEILPGARPTSGQITRDPVQWRLERRTAQKDAGANVLDHLRAQEQALAAEGARNATPNVIPRDPLEVGIAVMDAVGARVTSQPTGIYGAVRQAVDDTYDAAGAHPGVRAKVPFKRILNSVRKAVQEKHGRLAWEESGVDGLFKPYRPVAKTPPPEPPFSLPQAADMGPQPRAFWEDLVSKGILPPDFVPPAPPVPKPRPARLQGMLDVRKELRYQSRALNARPETASKGEVLRTALGALDDAVDAIPLRGAGAAAQALARKARGLARVQSDLFQRGSPRTSLIRDIVEQRVPPDQIITRLRSAPVKDVRHIIRVLTDPEVPGATPQSVAAGRKTVSAIRSGMLDYILNGGTNRGALRPTGADVTVSTAILKNNLRSIRGLKAIFTKSEVQGLQKLARVADLLKEAPPSMGVPLANMSGTAATLIDGLLSRVAILPLIGKEAAIGRSVARAGQGVRSFYRTSDLERISKDALEGRPYSERQLAAANLKGKGTKLQADELVARYTRDPLRKVSAPIGGLLGNTLADKLIPRRTGLLPF